MIRRAEECEVEVREHMKGGDGSAKLTSFISGPEELRDKGRLYSKITLEPGCSIGYHVHEHDTELFYFMTGSGIYTDGDKEVTVNAGDVAICPVGTGHAVSNRGDETLEFVAVIVYE